MMSQTSGDGKNSMRGCCWRYRLTRNVTGAMMRTVATARGLPPLPMRCVDALLSLPAMGPSIMVCLLWVELVGESVAPLQHVHQFAG